MEQETREFIKAKLGKEVRIKKAYKITNTKKMVMVIASSKDWQQKREIMNKRKELEKDIWIEDDLTRKEREIQKRLREKAKEEKERGNKVRIGIFIYMKIQIGEETFRWNEREQKLEEEKRRGGLKMILEYCESIKQMRRNMGVLREL